MSDGERGDAGVAHDAEYVRAADGERLYVQRWRPAKGQRRVAIVLAHGLAEHTDCYVPFARHFSTRGAAIYAQDHRGFGRSGGRRGHVPRHTRYVDDLLAVVKRARAENPGLPLVLVGHSMGGTIALLFTLRHPDLLTCAIYSAPALIVGLPVPAWKRLLGHTMTRLYPTYTNRGVIRPERLTRDPEMQQATAQDTLRHPLVTARLYTEMFVRAPREVLARAAEIGVPFLVLHGTDDLLVPAEASQRLYAAATVAGRALRLYPGLRHELFREVEREQVFADVTDWLGERGISLDHEPSARSRQPSALP